MPLFYISFASAHEFLGATVVNCANIDDAVPAATRAQCNPGGEAAIYSLPDDFEDVDLYRGMIGRIVDLKELRSTGHRKIKEVDEELADLAGELATVVCEDCNRRPS